MMKIFENNIGLKKICFVMIKDNLEFDNMIRQLVIEEIVMEQY